VLSRIRAFETLVEDGVNGRLVAVGQPGDLAAAILDAWEHREERGRAATETVRGKFDTTLLYRELALSLRAAAASGGRGPALAPA
jgi:hypothetical protein